MDGNDLRVQKLSLVRMRVPKNGPWKNQILTERGNLYPSYFWASALEMILKSLLLLPETILGRF